MSQDDPSRRAVLKQLGVIGAGGLAAAVSSVTGAATPADAPATGAAAVPEPVSHAYVFLQPPEAAFVEAAADRFIPADDLTPGGTDCGVAQFIDRQLASAWGSGDKLYMQGPWHAGKPTQGYQLPMTPAEFFRAGVAATAAHCATTYHKDFDRLTEAQQIEVLQGLEQGKIELPGLPTKDFFALLLDLSMQGFFADPLYGGNRDKVSWKMIGYPGVIAIYSEHIKNYRNKRYTVEPTSIADLS